MASAFCLRSACALHGLQFVCVSVREKEAKRFKEGARKKLLPCVQENIFNSCIMSVNLRLVIGWNGLLLVE